MKKSDAEARIAAMLEKNHENPVTRRAPTRVPRWMATALLGAGLSLSVQSCFLDFNDAQPAYGMPMCEYLEQSVSVHLLDQGVPVEVTAYGRFAITIDGVWQVDHQGLDTSGNITLSLCTEDYNRMDGAGFEICVTDSEEEYAPTCVQYDPGYEGLDDYFIDVELLRPDPQI
ncbi:hypothetical protein KKF84_13325 [Myxococcota bacterium]|nr:hypothetical protein [Myxococcota bacterium]MBU1536300.1 hypothetical protein [Myxococcota bacterium]